MSQQDMVGYAHTMARYNRWMNERIYELCAALSDDDRKRDMGAFFRSIHGTLNHLLLADRLWMARFQGGTFEIRSLDEELYTGFAELRAQREQEDRAIIGWVDTLSEADMAGELRYTSASNPQPRRHPLALAVMHFFNHQTHHRGQVTTLLKQQGIDPGVTDLLWMPDAADT